MVAAVSSTAGAAVSAAGLAFAERDAREAGRSVSDAATFGLASGLGSASIRLTSAGSTFCGLAAA